ncbi:MAG TPA: CocE/NonD family hydrolase [Kofleriaceae bacterium]|nr:CocE/NonD family hydrolase [Kofleriaceae bacterium]
MRTAWLLGVLAACGDLEAPTAQISDHTAAVTAPGFIEVVPIATHDAYVAEGVAYFPGSLIVVGQICRPAAAGRYPIILFNHGGFDGLGAEWDGALCAAAGNGYVIAMSSYRGEDGSQGSVEICDGEVDDSLQLLALVDAQPYADPSHAGMIGRSGLQLPGRTPVGWSTSPWLAKRGQRPRRELRDRLSDP